MKIKYTVFEDIYDYPCSICMPMIIFPGSINHSYIAKQIQSQPITAGFINLKNGNCYGKSLSLNLKSNPSIDNKIFKI